jgi:hypothetical protein
MADEPTQEQLAEMDAQYPRGFRAVWPDGFVVHGVQFPSGRCVVDSPAGGLWKAAVSFEALELHESAVIDWDPGINWDGESRGRTAGYAEAVKRVRQLATTNGPLFTPKQIADLLEAAAPSATTQESAP